LRISFTPGTQWSYSGEGYSYLQSVITRLAGRTDSTRWGTYELGHRVCASDFGDYMIANLLNPFGMTSSGYVWNETIDKKLASAHDKNGQPIQRRKSTETERRAVRFGGFAANHGYRLREVLDRSNGSQAVGCLPAQRCELNATSTGDRSQFSHSGFLGLGLANLASRQRRNLRPRRG